MKRKVLFVLLAIFTAFSALSFSACAKNKNEKISIVTTVFSEYDWVMNILGEESDRFDVKLLLDSGADLHSYQPSVDDMARVSSCDMFVYVGGESDEWVDGALKTAVKKDKIVFNLLERLGDGAKEEEIVEGMEGEEEEGEEEGEEEEKEYDEHVWLSLKNAAFYVKELSKEVSKLDSENAKTYENNAEKYIEKLNALDEKYEKAVRDGEKKTLLFADRFPFRYLTDDYGLTYYAAFVGCSAETEASFETVVFLAQKTDELGLKTILKIESSDGSIARTVKESTKGKDQEILTMDSLQSATSKEYAGGRTYLAVMEENLTVLKKALE